MGRFEPITTLAASCLSRAVESTVDSGHGDQCQRVPVHFEPDAFFFAGLLEVAGDQIKYGAGCSEVVLPSGVALMQSGTAYILSGPKMPV